MVRQSASRYVFLVLPGKGARKRDGILRWRKGVGLISQGSSEKWLYRQCVWGYQSMMVPRDVKKEGNQQFSLLRSHTDGGGGGRRCWDTDDQGEKYHEGV